jgi:hypothetical protein
MNTFPLAVLLLADVLEKALKPIAVLSFPDVLAVMGQVAIAGIAAPGITQGAPFIGCCIIISGTVENRGGPLAVLLLPVVFDLSASVP